MITTKKIGDFFEPHHFGGARAHDTAYAQIHLVFESCAEQHFQCRRKRSINIILSARCLNLIFFSKDCGRLEQNPERD
jgi:hypothetical protein